MSNKVASIKKNAQKGQQDRLSECMVQFANFLRWTNDQLLPMDRPIFLSSLHAVLGRAVEAMNSKGEIDAEKLRRNLAADNPVDTDSDVTDSGDTHSTDAQVSSPDGDEQTVGVGEGQPDPDVQPTSEEV